MTVAGVSARCGAVLRERRLFLFGRRSIPAVAERLGVSATVVGGWERGDRQLTVARLHQYAEVLGTTAGAVMASALERP